MRVGAANREKQLNDIEAQIKKERERLYRLERATEQLRQLENDLHSVCGGISSTVSAQLSVVPVTKLATMMSRMKMGATNLTSTL